VHHRVKNNLAIISSMMEMQKIDADPEAADVLSASQSVINSISKVHEKLYKSTELDRVEMKTYLSELIAELEDTFRTRERNIHFDPNIDEMHMLTRSAVSAGLIVNEIITNAVKYAFVDRDEGIIKVSMQDLDDSVQLIVENNGVPIDKEEIKEKKDSLGMTMISVLVDRLNGELKMSSDEWTRFMISFDKGHIVKEH
jgi:two-component sensor histidine kinase